MGTMLRPVAMVSMLACAGVACAQTQPQALTLHYQDRPPYSSAGPGGAVEGLVATPAAAALTSAGIPFEWQLTPSQRQLALIQSGRGLQCGVGWFRNPEREARGRFSGALYQDKPFAALVRLDAPIVSRRAVTELLAQPQPRLLVKEGYSYGAFLDRLIAGMPTAPVRASVDPPQMARMLQAGRADWMLVAPEEADALLLPGLRLIEFSDMPLGPSRHLYCSEDVPAAWIERIDRALAPGRR